MPEFYDEWYEYLLNSGASPASARQGAMIYGGSHPRDAPDFNPEWLPETGVDYYEQVQALMPWLPAELARVYADEWAETGDRTVAVAAMRQSPQYDRFFAGNRRPDGTFRMDEAAYMARLQAYRTHLQDFGLNAEIFQDRFVDLIEGDVSGGEFRERLGAAYEGIVNNIPQVRQLYASRFGLELSDAAIFASVIDPRIGEDIVNRRIAVAQVGGEGLARGFDSSFGFFERLTDAGLDQATARRFFSQAERMLPTLSRLVDRHNDPDDTFSLDEFADANVLGDAEQAQRMERLVRAETSLFSSAQTIGTSRAGALTGLRQR